MKNLFDLRSELIKVFDNLSNNSLELAKAKEFNNAAGKIISTIRCQLEYSKLRNEQPNIPFVAEASGK